MAKFNRAGTRTGVSSPIKTEARPSGRTYEGAPGYARDAKSELFLLAVANMVGENTFYEKAGDRDQRFTDLVVSAGWQDPDWTAAFLKWLRAEGNMRSAPVVAAAELV
ncbi:TROVE domain-containing protein, partial [Actinomadura adrarensis]